MLPRRVVESLLLEVFRRRLDEHLSGVSDFEVPERVGGWTRWPFVVSSSSVILIMIQKYLGTNPVGSGT